MALRCFYVDNSRMGATPINEAIQLWKESRNLFKQGNFKLKKWKSSEEEVLATIPEELRDVKGKQKIHHNHEYTKVLGVEWNIVTNSFRPVISCYKDNEPLTKRVLVSNIARLLIH